ncbi:YhfG family protein [Pseudomonas cannabina]|nr:YhfG family protein [Pseudomonas cannabina]SDR41085.1 hypothetical protein SAMN05216597_4426 [Pseudomonas cannabina]
MLKLGVNGWAALLAKLKVLRVTLCTNDLSISMIEEGSFKQAKHKLSETLGFPITAKNQSELDVIIRTCSTYFFESNFDPHRRFEEKKLKNFISSSKLEGINIPYPDGKRSLEIILAKHRR